MTSSGASSSTGARSLLILGAAQFVMVLDSSVMNVSISQLVEDFDTEVTKIQAAITCYALVMAALMITGGKLGDIWGRRRAFAIGLMIYGCGSALTAVSWNVPVLILGWSILEGIGASLVLPALAALIAGNFEGAARARAYGIIGGVAGAGVAVGPILGGWVTSNLSWRYVFAGEVVLVIGILLGCRLLADAPRPGPAPKVDVLGAVLSAVGLSFAVLGVLQASSWGWVVDKNSPIAPFGFALTPFVVGGGLALIGGFARWQRRREASGLDPLVHLDNLRIAPLRAGLWGFLSQNLILMGIFFVVPLYLQVVQGYDAFETGLRMLPVSITLLVVSMLGPVWARVFGPRRTVRIGLFVLAASALVLLAQVDPEIDTWRFSVGMALLGIGAGALASQLGNVVQSSVDATARSEAGGLQYTAQQLGAAVGTALIGAIVISGLAGAFQSRVQSDPAVSAATQQQVTVALDAGVQFVPLEQAEAAALEAGLPQDEVDALAQQYAEAQLQALKAGLLAAAFIVGLSLFATGGLPRTLEELELDDAAPVPTT